MSKLFSNERVGVGRGRRRNNRVNSVDLDIPGETTAIQRPQSIGRLIICGVVLIGIIAVVAALIVNHFRERALTNSERELANTALLLARHLDEELEQLEFAQTKFIEQVRSAGIASPEEFEREMSGRDVHLMLKTKIDSLPQVGRLSLIGSDGKLINSSYSWPTPDAVNVTDRKYFKALKSDPQLSTFVSEPVRSHLTNTWTLILAHKLTGSSGQFLGLVLVGVELAHFEQFFASVTLGEHATIALFNRDGTLIARHPRVDLMIGRNLITTTLVQQDHGTARLVSTVDGRDRLVSAHKLSHFPIVIMASTTVSAALADWWHQTRLVIGVAALSVLVIAIFLYLIVRQMLREDSWSKHSLKLQKQRLDTAVNNMNHGLVLLDASERVVIVNRRYIEMYRLSPDVVKPGCTLRDLIAHRKETGTFAGNIDDYCSSILRNVAKRAKAQTVIHTADGRSIQLVNLPLTNGGWVSTHEDITEREKLRDHLDAALNNMAQGLAMFDGEQRLVICNTRFAEMYGFPTELVEPGATIRELLNNCVANGCYAGRDPDEMLAATMQHLSTKANGYYTTTLDAGQIYGVSVTPMSLGGIVTTHEDITERRRAEARIAHMARHDALTDLPNRVLLREQLERVLIGARRDDKGVAVLCLDLDRFKEVNDTLGHAVGDEVLKAVGTRLRTCVRENIFVSRLGGDEFAMVVATSEPARDAAALAGRIIAVLIAHHVIDGHQLTIGTSIGIAVAPSDGDSAEKLLINADLALYGAKGEGRGTYRFFEPEMNIRMQERRVLEMDLHKALEQGQLTIYYQPLLNVANNRICGCEALLRWNHPGRGMVLPADFIPVAEATGLIMPIGEWVLREACREAAVWPAGMKVAVNLSAVQFKSANLVQTVVSALAATGLSPARLEIEITESVLLGDRKTALDLLGQLRSLGVQIALDDFGTGYSSLSYLHCFPFDKIKIDRCFVRDACIDGQKSLAILKTITLLGRSLGMATTVEGVETQEQFELVRGEGCNEMQGYYFSRPKPASEIAALLLSQAENPAVAA